MMTQLHGAWPTMVTPFDENLKIDSGAYRAVIQWYLAHQVGGLYANCLSSEMYHLSNAERLQLAREAVRAADGRVPVAATGNLGSTTAEHLDLCQRMAGEGVDVVMLVVPDFLDEEQALEDYFLAMAAGVDAPLGLYECPMHGPPPLRAHPGCHLSPALSGRLARSGRFIAYKETSCDIGIIRAHLEATRDTPMAILQANTPYMLDAVRAGTPGSMTIAAIWLPELVAAVIEKAQAGDADAERLHAKLCAMKLAQRAVHPGGSKYLLGKRGLPIHHRGRAYPELRPETLHALDYAAQAWFDVNGELKY
jgi:4-hydroxy-tetrahydrodipicolinate synthase